MVSTEVGARDLTIVFSYIIGMEAKFFSDTFRMDDTYLKSEYYNKKLLPKSRELPGQNVALPHLIPGHF